MIKLLKYSLIFVAVSLFVTHCMPDYAPVEAPPAFLEFVVAPAEGDTIKNDNVTFSWMGSEENFQFKYKVDYIGLTDSLYEYIPYGEYSHIREVAFENLDDGLFTVSLMGISDDIEGGPVTRSFYVDAVKNSSFQFFRRTNKIILDSTGTISIYAEEIAELFSFNTIISLDTNFINLVSVESGEAIADFYGAGATPVIKDTTVLVRDKNSGNLMVTAGVALSLSSGNIPFSGTGEVIKISYHTIKSGITELEFISNDGRKTDGTRIEIAASDKAIIKIQ